jgi:ubiquinone/menaquinone biosynthesis C-methylase UbiE
MPNDREAATIKYYNEHADEWVKEHSDVSPFMQRRLEQFMDLLPGPLLIDLACGSGRFAKYFSEHPKRKLSVVGIDAAENLVVMARKHAPYAMFRVLDMRELRTVFPENSFNGAWVSAALHHIPKDEAKSVLKDLHNILRSGGALYVSVKQSDDKPDENRFIAYYESDELRSMVAEARFKVLDVMPATGETSKSKWLCLYATKP